MKNPTAVKSDLEVVTSKLLEIARGNLDVNLSEIHEPELLPLVQAISEMTGAMKVQFVQAQSMGASMRNLVESIPVAMVKWSTKGEVLLVNRRAISLWGYSTAHEITSGSRVQNLFSRTDELKRLMQEVAEHGATSDFELTMRRQDGEERLVSCTAAALRDEEKVVNGFVGAFRDIRDQREFEKQLVQMEKLESISQFAAGLAHDLNNILCGILPNIEILRRQMAQEAQTPATSDRQLRLLESIDRSAQCGVTLAKQLMSFSRKNQLTMTVTNLNSVVMDSLHQLKQSLGSGIRIETDLTTDLWNVEADREQIEEILIHLGKYAQQSMNGSGVLRVSTQNTTLVDSPALRSRGTQPGAYVKLIVADAGRGIAPDHLLRIFEPFFDAEGWDRGSGLALSMVFGMVKNHRGFIDVESRLNVGTTFKVYLPRTEKKLASDTPPPTTGNRRVERILIVDDEALVRDAMTQLLCELGYEVHAAQDGDEALMRITQREEYDLVILDMQMPRMAGPETLTRVRDVNPDLKVVLMSGHCPTENVQDLLQRFKCGFLQKPFRLAEISKVVRGVLDETSPH